MSQVLDETRRSYAAQRIASRGAAITLCPKSAGYEARFDCATRAAEILGTRHLTDYATPPERLPILTIPWDDTYKAIQKLAERYSVALIETVTDEGGTRFVLVWKIDAHANEVVAPDTATEAIPAGDNLDDY